MNKYELIEQARESCKKLRGKPGGLKSLRKWAERQERAKKLRQLTKGGE